MDIQSIVSHPAPRHLDDFLAMALIKRQNPNAKIEYIHPQQVPHHYIDDDKICLIDVGGDYNPSKNNFDHHQSKNIASSIVLVLKEQNKLYSHPVIQAIDIIDREGFASAKEKFGLQGNKEIDKKRRMVLMSDLNDLSVCNAIVEVLDKITLLNSIMSKMDFDGFIEDLYNTLDSNKLLESVKRRIKKEEKDLQDKIDKASVWRVPFTDYVVVYSSESFAPFHSGVFEKLNADVIIEKNGMNPYHTSIVKNTKKSDNQLIDLKQIFKYYDKVFYHNTGFIAVIDKKVEEIEVNKVLEVFPKAKEIRKEWEAEGWENDNLPDLGDVPLIKTPEKKFYWQKSYKFVPIIFAPASGYTRLCVGMFFYDEVIDEMHVFYLKDEKFRKLFDSKENESFFIEWVLESIWEYRIKRKKFKFNDIFKGDNYFGKGSLGSSLYAEEAVSSNIYLFNPDKIFEEMFDEFKRATLMRFDMNDIIYKTHKLVSYQKAK